MELIIIILLVMQLEFIGLALVVLIKRRKAVQLEAACFIDTSALIDGRILDVARAGFIPRHLVISRSVLSELQLLADGADSDKRSRARHGLDIAKALKDLEDVTVTVFEDQKGAENVDNQLLVLARKYRGSICTIDYNLNKVAQAEAISVLNVNELAKNLRMNFLPGERASIIIAQKGNDAHQGVGYMADGTMVVVEQAKQDIGKMVNVEFIRSLQTDAGRMLFAKKLGAESREHKPRRVPSKPGIKSSTKKFPKNSEDSLVKLANER